MDTDIRFRELISKHLGEDALDMDADAAFYQTLGADSLDAIEIVIDTEQEFGVVIDDSFLRPEGIVILRTYINARSSVTGGQRPKVCPGCCAALIRARRAVASRPCEVCRDERTALAAKRLAGGAR
jgi:acyl carrier protein